MQASIGNRIKQYLVIYCGDGVNQNGLTCLCSWQNASGDRCDATMCAKAAALGAFCFEDRERLVRFPSEKGNEAQIKALQAVWDAIHPVSFVINAT